MRDLFDVIKNRLKCIKGVHYIEPWNNQEQADIEKKQKAIRRAAIYVEFVVDEVKSVGLGIKDKVLTVRLYMSIKNLRSDKSTTIDFYEKVAEQMEGFGCTEGFQPYFSTFYEKAQQFDIDHDNVELPFVEYGTIYKDISGYRFKTGWQEVTGVTPKTEVNIVDKIG